METVVILDHNNKDIEGYKRMLEASREELDCKFFHSSAETVEYLRKYPVAVLISELEMPEMSGKEIFDIVEMVSPATVRVAMTQVKDVSETIGVFNQTRIFKMILKPFFLPEDLINPIHEALGHFHRLEAERKKQEKLEQELKELAKEEQELSKALESKKRKNRGISHVALGIIRGNLDTEVSGMGPKAASAASEVCEELLQEFMRYYLYESCDFNSHVEYLLKKFHHPENGCMMQIRNKTGHELPEGIMERIGYGMFLGGCMCQKILSSYRAVMLVEKEGKNYTMRIFCQYPGKGNIYRISDKRARKLVVDVIKELTKSLSAHMATGTKERHFAIKLYFGKEKGRNE